MYIHKLLLLFLAEGCKNPVNPVTTSPVNSHPYVCHCELKKPIILGASYKQTNKQTKKERKKERKQSSVQVICLPLRLSVCKPVKSENLRERGYLRAVDVDQYVTLQQISEKYSEIIMSKL
jgi:hypothetical protein